MSKKFVVPSVFTAVDKFSGPVSKMSRNAETSMARMERKFRRVGDVSRNVSEKSAMIGVAILAPLALAANEAVKFESAMAGVAKVANVDIGSKAFEKLSTQAKQLGVTLGIDAKEAAGLMANLAQGGVAIDDLDRVARQAGKMGVAFDMTGDMAGEAFIKTKNALGGTIEETQAVMDTVNMLSNTFAAQASDIVTFMAKSGSAVARQLGTSGSEMAAFGTQLISTGKSAEVSATLMKTFGKVVARTESLKKVFDSVGGGADGMMKVIEDGSKLGEDAQNSYFAQFGENAALVQLLAKDFDKLAIKVDASRNSMQNAGSVQEEFENITNKAGFKLEKMKSRIMSVAITLGTALIPIISKAVEKITPLIESFSTWMSENKSSVKTFIKVAAVVGTLAIATSLVSGAVAIASKGFAIYKLAIKSYAWAVDVAKTVQLLWNAAMVANPVGLIIVSVAALAAGVYLLSDAFSSQTREQRLNNEVNKRALENSIDQRVEVQLLFSKLRKLNPESASYATTLAKIEGIQPGITKQYGLQSGAADKLNEAEKRLLATITERADLQAKKDVLADTAKEVVNLKNKEHTYWEETLAAWSSPAAFFGDADAIKKSVMASRQVDIDKKEASMSDLEGQIISGEEALANPQKTQTVATTNNINKASKEQFEFSFTPEFQRLLTMNRKGGTTNNMAMPETPPTN